MQIKRSGFVAVVGRANVGKSTLLNTLIGQKVAIVSHRAQTTRERIFGVLTRGEMQIVFVDTPGYHTAKNRLGEHMIKQTTGALEDIDLALLVVEPNCYISEVEQELIERLRRQKAPVILVINKMDTVQKQELLPVIAKYSEQMAFAAVIPISAKLALGVDELLTQIEAYIPEGVAYFPEDAVTDRMESQLAADIVREKLLFYLDKEVPHGIAVYTEAMKKRADADVYDIDVVIYCEKASHKGIIIGKNGAMLKRVGVAARRDIEKMLAARVYLTCFVKVAENWRNKENIIRDLGL